MGHSHASANPIMKWLGIAGGLATAACMTMILVGGFHFERYAAAVLIAAVGIPIGAFSNSNGANPNGQSYMEWFGFTCFLCGMLKFLHVGDLFAKLFADSPLMSGLAKVLMAFF